VFHLERSERARLILRVARQSADERESGPPPEIHRGTVNSHFMNVATWLSPVGAE